MVLASLTNERGNAVFSSNCLAIFLVVVLLLTAPPAWGDDPKAREIMERVDARDDGDNQALDMEMVLVDKNRKTRIRRLRTFSRDRGKDVLRLMFCTEPPDVKGTALLIYDRNEADVDDDHWFYLPALRKTKRIASEEQCGSFMGSDFSYADMTRRHLNEYDYTLLKDLQGSDGGSWLVQSIPRSSKVIDKYCYTKSVLFVRKDNFFVTRAVHWMTKKNHLKYMDVKSLELIDGIWVATEIHMTTKKGGRTLHKTIMQNKNVKFNQDLGEGFFTIRQMEKGL